MKICFINWGLTKLPRGMERVGAMLANEMADRGHEVEILVFDPDRQPSVFPLREEIELYYMDHLMYKEGRESTLEHLTKRGTDVVVSMFSWFGTLFPSQMLQGSQIPLIISEHNSPEIIIPRWNKEERLAAMSGADKIHLLMPEYKNSLPESMRERVSVIPNAVEPVNAFASPGGKSSDKKTILVVTSFMEETKQLSILVRAFALISKQFPDWRVHVFGGGDDENIIRGLISEHDLEDSFILCGHTDDLNTEYRNAHLFCLPSKFEGCPCALQEAQAHALPAIGFAGCPGINHLIKHEVNGLLAPEMTPECLAKNLVKLLKEDDLRDRYGKSALNDSKEYTPQKVFEQWEQLILEAAALKGNNELYHLDPYSPNAKWRAELRRLADRERAALPTDPDRRIGSPRVSVIVPVYNVSDYLFECLDSVRSQTLKDIEIICVEDCSTDSSAKKLEEISKEESRIIVERHKVNRGLAAARNTGMSFAQGDFIYFLDSDDFFAREDSLENLYIRAVEDRADETIGGLMRWFSDSGVQDPGWHKGYMGSEVHGKPLEQLPQLWCNVIACNKLLRREFLDTHSLRFDESLRKHEDDLFSCKLHILAKRISIRPSPTYIYRQGRINSIMATADKEDIFHLSEVCCQIIKFIESKPEYSQYRNSFYPMYTARMLQNVELLSSSSPSQKEKDRLWELLKKATSYLPEDLQCIQKNKRKAFELIRQDERQAAWDFAIEFTRSRPNFSKANQVVTMVSEEELKQYTETERIQYNDQLKRNKQLSDQIELIQNSISWRLTSGLRRVLHRIKS